MNDKDYEDVFVLSLPAFNWFRASGTSAKRAWHRCDLIGKRQMIVIGGAEPTAALGATPDPWTHGLGIFDMTELSWSNSYNASAQPYEQPSIVKQFYATNSPQPSSWNDPTLAAIFATKSATTTAKPSPTSTGGSSGSPVAHHNNAGAIGGGGLGGLVLLCLLLGLVLLLLRRQRRKQRAHQPRPIPELDKKPAVQEMPNNLNYKPEHQLGPAEPWELSAARRDPPISEVEG